MLERAPKARGECAGDIIRTHGVPREVARVSTKVVNVYQVEPTDVLTLMPPNLPMDRSMSTYLILGVLAGIPAEHPARPAIEQHASFVSNPAVPSVLLAASAREVGHVLLAEEWP